MSDDTRYYVTDEYGKPCLVREESIPGGYTKHVVTYRHKLDDIHPVLWPTLLAEYGLGDAVDPLKPGFGTDIDAEVRATYQRDGLTAAILEYRQFTNTAPAEAREAVERICDVHTDRVWEVADAPVRQWLGFRYREHAGQWQFLSTRNSWMCSVFTSRAAMERAGYRLVEVTGHVGDVR